MSLLDTPIPQMDAMCSTCGQQVEDQQNHFEWECPTREYECPHCSYKDTHEEITGDHLEECPNVIVPCTNEGCNEKVTRISMMEHFGSCPKAMITCQYAFIGCEKKFKREEASRHENDHLKQHLKLAIKSIRELKEKPPKPAKPTGELTSDVFKVKNYLDLKQKNKSWVSPTFYTSIGGYKLVMVIFPNGYGEDEGSHVSCFVCLMPGENDDTLEWTMKGEITVELLNQLEDKNHTIITLTIDEDNEFNKVDEEEIENIEEDLPGVGQSNFIHHTYLEHNPTLNIHYLKDDTLYIRITVSKLLTKTKPWLVTT